MNRQDARVRVTKSMFHSALLSLLKETPIGKVSVKALCEKACLNRGTFYLHYSQPSDVLKEIENDFIAENMAAFDSYWESQRDIGVMTKIFTCIMEHKDVSRILMSDNGDSQFQKSLVSLCREGIINEWQKEFPEYDRERLDFLLDYVFSGSIRLILNWIDDDGGLSIAAFTQRLERLGHYSLVAAGEFWGPSTHKTD